MAYRHLSDERRRYIDETVEALRSRYITNLRIDFSRLAQELGIILIETDKVVVDLSARIYGRNYVFVQKHSLPSVGEFGKSHEFGHVILHAGVNLPGRVKEDEANYFAERLTGIGTLKSYLLFSDVLFYILRHPIRSLTYVVGWDNPDLIKLTRELDSK